MSKPKKIILENGSANKYEISSKGDNVLEIPANVIIEK